MKKVVENSKGTVSVIIIISLILVGIGGKVFMDRREEKKELELLAVEKESVEVLKNMFENIKEVNIEQAGYNSMTRSYNMLVTMTDIKEKSVYFSYGFVKDSGEIADYGIEDEDIQKEGKTIGKIKVIYSNGEEEEL